MWSKSNHSNKFWREVALLLGIVVATLSSCSPAIPEEQTTRCTIASLRGLYRGYPRIITEDLVIAGQVVSDDRYGQYRHRLAVQDASGGIFISIDYPELHALHKLGDSIEVDCRGLTIGGYGGSAMLGGPSEGESEVTPLSSAEWLLHYTTLSQGSLPSPKHLSIASIGPEDLATRVRVCSVEIVEAGEMWAEVAEERQVHLVDSHTLTDTLSIRLSNRGDYNDSRIPSGVVDVVGVVDYFSSDYQLLVASPSAVLEREEK